MWIESTIDEIIQFVRRFLMTFADTLFRPSKVFDRLKTEDKSKYLRPLIYCFLILVIYVSYARSYQANRVVVRDTGFISRGEIVNNVISTLPTSFNLNAFLYAFPVFLAGYLLLFLVARLLKLTPVWKRRFVEFTFL